MNSLGEAIKKYRSEHENMSQREFARQCGLSHVYIMNLEKNFDPKSGKENVPTLTTIAAIAKGMGKPAADLFEKIAEVVSVQGLSEDQKIMVRGMIDYLRRGGESNQDSGIAQGEAKSSRGVGLYSDANYRRLNRK